MNTVDKETLKDRFALLAECFAPRTDGFYKKLGSMILGRKYTVAELDRGIDFVLENCGYNQLSISAVLDAIENNPSKPRFMCP